jgi:UDP:flavonoid glycosyltransferase YjiC (YdhE family)
MHVLLTPFGSAGDVYPLIGIGRELLHRGHRITMITNAYFEDIARRAGFDFAPFSSREDYFKLIENPDLWHPQKAVPLLANTSVIPAIPVIYQLIAERYRPGETVVVSGSLALGARVAQEKLGVPLTMIHLQPAVFRSRHEPPTHPGLEWIHRLPSALRPAAFRLMDFMIDGIYAKPLNEFRGSLGLAPIKRVMDNWWHSPTQTLALFPPWFAAPQRDWPAVVSVLDFPQYDAASLEPPPAELREFLQSGTPPIVFTPGSAMKTGADFFEISAQACQLLGRRGLFLTRYPEQLPKNLPPTIAHFSYAPFSQVLPQAAAFVHHGGIGTVAQGLKAGVPQLVMPCSYDQLDNATRVQKLGAGSFLLREKYQPATVAEKLGQLLGDATMRARCAYWASKAAGGDAISKAADAMEAQWNNLKQRATA